MPSERDLSLAELQPEDASVLAGFIAICGEHIHRTAGLDHWYPIPQLDPIVERSMGSDLFGVMSSELLVAVFSLSARPLPYYGDLAAFRLPATAPRYLSALAVLPSHQGSGVGAWAMQQADRLVAEMGGDAIRFDAITANTPAVEFYRRLDYSEGGVIQVGRLTVTCFERSLEPLDVD